MAIEFSIDDGKHRGILTAFLHGNCHAIDVTFIIEAGFFYKLRIINVGLRFRRPRVKLRDKWSVPKLAKIHKKNCARIRGHKRQRFFARRAGVPAPLSNCEKCNRAQEDKNYGQCDLCPFGHGLRTIHIHDGVALSTIVPSAQGLAASNATRKIDFGRSYRRLLNSDRCG